jgi:cytochrome-b5 reductase
MSAAGNKFTSSAFINGIYVPSGLLIFGCLIVKKEWLPYAIALSLVLGGWKVLSSRMLYPALYSRSNGDVDIEERMSYDR